MNCISFGVSCREVNLGYSLNSLKGGYIGDDIYGTTIGVIKGYTRSLDNGSYGRGFNPSTLDLDYIQDLRGF